MLRSLLRPLSLIKGAAMKRSLSEPSKVHGNAGV
jgi:hypothetical protein